jgi:cation:H+ antiporter
LNAVLTFLGCGAAVVVAGVVLARAADEIAEVTGIGRLWVGSVLLAAATSLPELTTGIAAVRLGAVDLAVGDLFGSSMASMMVLAIIDLMPPRRHVLKHASTEHALAACLAITLTAAAGLLVFAQPSATVLGIGPGSLLLLVLYLTGTRAVYRQIQTKAPGPDEEANATGRIASLRKPIAGFAVATVVIVLVAPHFAAAAKEIAERSGLGMTFVGTWLVGVSTALPELVASVAAVRMGAFDLAVGNLFGSNALNIAILFALDVVWPGPTIYTALDPNHALSAMLGVILTSLGLAAVLYRAERRFAMIEPDSWIMVLAYLAGVWLLYEKTVMH